jgi:hypothetical protein
MMPKYKVYTQHGNETRPGCSNGPEFICPISVTAVSPSEAATTRFNRLTDVSKATCTALLVVGFDTCVIPVNKVSVYEPGEPMVIGA